jgi:hypothetical protein
MLADGSEYRGHYGLSVAQLMDFHRPRLALLAVVRTCWPAKPSLPAGGRSAGALAAAGISRHARLDQLQLPRR